MSSLRNVDFLGRGWSFPPGTRTGVGIESCAGEQKIQESIWIILATAPGDRIMRPDFGCGIHRLVFEVNNSRTAGAVVDEVRQALIKWEPRIDVLEVTAEPRAGGEQLYIHIRYRVRSTNNLFNLVYPFYLGGSFEK